MQSNENVKSRNGEIDILRFIFAIWIVLYHFNKITSSNTISNLFSYTYMCVDFFFIVTGYLTAKSAICIYNESPDVPNATWRFLIKKIGSFYPHYLTVILIQIIINIFVYKDNFALFCEKIAFGVPEYTLSFFGLNTAKTLYTTGHWYLSVLVIVLLTLYPLIARYGKWMLNIVFPLGSIIIIGYLYGTNGFYVINDSKFLGLVSAGILRGFASTMIGASLFSLVEHINRYKYTKIAKILLTIIKIGVIAVFFYFVTFEDKRRYFDIHAVLLCAIGIGLSFSNMTYSIPQTKFSNFLGKLSLSIYIYHGIVYRLFYILMPPETIMSLSYMVYVYSIIASLGISILFMYCVPYVCRLIKKIRIVKEE